MANHVIIAAAGKGARMGINSNKVFLTLAGRPILYHTIKVFENCSAIDDIIIVTKKEDIDEINNIKNNNNFKKIKNIVIGGIERQDSVYNGLMSIKNGKNNDDNNIILVHNGSNPLVKENEIIECIENARIYGAAVVGFPVKDTLKEAKENIIVKTIDRTNLWQMQTPQAIQYGLFIKAFENAKKNNLKFTDDVALVEAIGHKVKIVQCSNENIKITTPEDLKIAEGIMMKRSGISNDARIGFGMDSHAFSEKEKPLILGGFTIPNEPGLEADSDGDIILHALFNAISQSIGERSLGYHATPLFKEKGVTDSREYLNIMLEKLDSMNFTINNIGITIEAKKPRLEQYSDKIRESLSTILKIKISQIGINYTSGDGLTAFGQGKGMQCFAVVTITRNPI
ncbi:2-C-methyl-D-erythritol 4-phosphate cytidylyltransferase [Candidatus Woesearchaeota archaeon]|nr:2-C-methyl-D-erythritol 4-phosphate cytidylyltransferase [Candidatus Woesearchaeota archaeon]